MKKKYIIISLIICSMIFGLIWIRFQSSSGKYTFTPEKWSSRIYSREYILDDLLSKYQLNGMSKENVRKLLGDEGLVQGTEFMYYIGKSPTGPVLFAISFDENGKVYSYGKIID